MNNFSQSNIEDIVLQLEEFSFFIKFRTHPKYLHYLNQLAKCVQEKTYQQDQYLIKKGEQCDQLFFILEGNIMIQSEYKVSRPISTSSSSQMLKNVTLSTITQQITKSRYQTVNKVKLASKYDVINEENALLSRLQSRENAICQTSCLVLELNFSDFQRIFSSQVSEIRHRISLFSKYFNFEEIDQSSVLSFCQACTEYQYVCGDKIYCAGEKAKGFYFVKSGTVEVCSSLNVDNSPSKKRQVIIDLVNSTEFCGLEEIYNQSFNRVYDAFIQSEKAKILFIPITYFDPDRSYAHSEIGKIDLYKVLMRLSKDKSKRYQQQLDKHKEQLNNQQNIAFKIVQREKSASQRVSIQEILSHEKRANQKYRNSISETSQPNYTAVTDVLMNPSFPYVLPPKPNNNLNKSLNSNSKSSSSQSSLSTILKLKMRNSSQSVIKSNTSRQSTDIDISSKKSRAESLIENQQVENENSQFMFYQNMIQSESENMSGNQYLPIHSTQQQNYNAIASTSALNHNYKVLFKKYLDNKQNKSLTQQYPNILNAPNQSKEKQLQILNEFDQKIPLPKSSSDEKAQSGFILSSVNNYIKPLTKNFQEKQELEYGGNLFNNLMVSNSMKNPSCDQPTINFNETQKFFQKQLYYKSNNKQRVTMTSFKSNKSLKFKENYNPTAALKTEFQDYQQNEGSIFSSQTSEENSPLKKKYSFSQRDNKLIISQRKSLKGKQLSFSDTKNRGSLLDTSTQNEVKSGIDNKKLLLLQQPKRRSITPLKQAQINIHPLNCLKQQQINYKDIKVKNKTEIEQSSINQKEKLKQQNESEGSFYEDTEVSEITSKSCLSEDSCQFINYA